MSSTYPESVGGREEKSAIRDKTCEGIHASVLARKTGRE